MGALVISTLGFLRAALVWLNAQPDGTLVLVGVFLLPVLTTVGLGLWKLARFIVRIAGDLWIRWLARRPSAGEYGFLDHGKRIEPLWGRIAKLRGGIFKTLTKTNTMARKYSAEVDAAKASNRAKNIERAFIKTAKSIRRPVRRLERLADGYAANVAGLHESYKNVLSRVGADIVVPQAIASFRKRQIPGYNVPEQLPQDLELFERERIALNKLRGQTYLLTRECDKYITALDTIIAGTREFILLCAKVEFTATYAKQLASLRDGTLGQQSPESTTHDSSSQLPLKE